MCPKKSLIKMTVVVVCPDIINWYCWRAKGEIVVCCKIEGGGR